MVQENIFKSFDYESEATKARLPCAYKRFSADGKNIPLKKNWSEVCCMLPVHFENVLNEVLNFELRKDDVFVSTFMKSGTTWMQECAWLLMNNLDFEKSKQKVVMLKSPYLEFKGLVPECTNPTQNCKALASPRLIKTHMPANLLPQEIWKKQQKMIYVARNVKDVIVSSFHFTKSVNLWQGNSFAEYVEDFLNSEIVFTPYWPHVVNIWLMRHELFIFFVTYEEMKRDLAGVLQRLCTFLGRPQLTQEELKESVEYLSFGSMKKNFNTELSDLIKQNLPGATDFDFLRRGVVGSFKDELTAELIAKIDTWSSEFLSQYGLKEEDIFGEF